MFIADTPTMALEPRAPDLVPNDFQRNTVIAACIMIFPAAVAWNLSVIRDAICAIKMMVIGAHELFHLLVGFALGGRLLSICIDPAAGGRTVLENLSRIDRRPGDPSLRPWIYNQRAVITMLAGYFGSAIFGFLYIFAAFDIVASKVASFTIAFGLLLPLLRAEAWVVYVSIFLSEALLIAMWFVDHGNALRFYVLFVGTLHVFYAVWDFCDEHFWGKSNTSDCTELAIMAGYTESVWAVMSFAFEAVVFSCAVIAGLAVFKKSPEQMYKDA